MLKRENRPDRRVVYSEAYVPVVRDGQVLGVVEIYVDQAERAASADRSFARIAGTVAALLTLLMLVAGYQFSSFGAADASNARTRRGCAIWRTTMYSAAH